MSKICENILYILGWIFTVDLKSKTIDQNEKIEILEKELEYQKEINLKLESKIFSEVKDDKINLYVDIFKEILITLEKVINEQNKKINEIYEKLNE